MRVSLVLLICAAACDGAVHEGSEASVDYTLLRLDDPARTEVLDDAGAWLATFTDGSRSVLVRGPSRTFDEDTAAAPVVTDVWVRIYPDAFAGKVDVGWLGAALADESPDILAVSMDYLGDVASYGPLLDGVRQEGSDFYDFLGVDWLFPSGMAYPEKMQLGDLDCSGFVRMVYGHHGGLPLSLAPQAGFVPRRSFEIFDAAPGVQVREPQAGDLLFFDASTDDGDRIDHVGIYLGLDTAGKRRFISSRRGADGPTMGDQNGASILDGTGLYAKSFRGIVRL